MTEQILSIRSVEGFKLPQDKGQQYFNTYDGYEIVTNRQKICVVVSNEQDCCESWGYIASDDDLESFVGAELREVTRTDTQFETMKLPEYGLDGGGVIFVTFDTNRGKFQLAVYNAHNGYYGHDAKVISEQLTISECL